jgi:hypothetical protein
MRLSLRADIRFGFYAAGAISAPLHDDGLRFAREKDCAPNPEARYPLSEDTSF